MYFGRHSHPHQVECTHRKERVELEPGNRVLANETLRLQLLIGNFVFDVAERLDGGLIAGRFEYAAKQHWPVGESHLGPPLDFGNDLVGEKGVGAAEVE